MIVEITMTLIETASACTPTLQFTWIGLTYHGHSFATACYNFGIRLLNHICSCIFFVITKSRNYGLDRGCFLLLCTSAHASVTLTEIPVPT